MTIFLLIWFIIGVMLCCCVGFDFMLNSTPENLDYNEMIVDCLTCLFFGPVVIAGYLVIMCLASMYELMIFLLKIIHKKIRKL